MATKGKRIEVAGSVSAAERALSKPFKSDSKPITAEQLIAKASASTSRIPAPSDAALVQLRKLLDYNDAGLGKHVGREQAIAMLQSHGWLGRSHAAVEALCKSLGRFSYARAE